MKWVICAAICGLVLAAEYWYPTVGILPNRNNSFSVGTSTMTFVRLEVKK